MQSTTDLTRLSDAAGGMRSRSSRFLPQPAQSLADLQIPASTVEQLIFKLLYYKGDMLGADLSREMGLRFSLIEEMVTAFKFQQLIQAKSSLGYGPSSAILALTEQGRRVARDYLEVNQYVGPAPVSLEQYEAAVLAQKMPANWLGPERLAKAFSHMVLTQRILDQVGPAVCSGRSFLIFGKPGNGKTQLAESLTGIQTSDIWVPYALEAQGNIIRVFDPIHHKLADMKTAEAEEWDYDKRWARCKRPFIESGGELALDMLDLRQHPVSKIYDSPLHMKANNGIYLIDDFGRQKAAPVEVLNRWIVPMERRIDYLTFTSGGKISVPFEAFLVFASNLRPESLGDEAFLRRIQYKMLMPCPSRDEFQQIFLRFCDACNLPMADGVADRFIERYYVQTKKPYRRCQPRDVISQAIDYIRFQRLPYELTDAVLDQAFKTCFVSEEELAE